MYIRIYAQTVARIPMSQIVSFIRGSSRNTTNQMLPKPTSAP